MQQPWVNFLVRQSWSPGVLESWTEDRERCRAAKIPDERDFRAKNDLAKDMVRRALTSPLPIAWVTADAAYGQEGRFRRLLEQSGLGNVLAVPKSHYPAVHPGTYCIQPGRRQW